MSESHHFHLDRGNDVPVLHLQTSGLGRDAVQEFGRDLLAYVDREQPLRLVINLAAVDEMSSLGLSKLMLADKRIRDYGGRLLTCEARGSVRQLISLAWMRCEDAELASITQNAAIEQLRNWTPGDSG